MALTDFLFSISPLLYIYISVCKINKFVCLFVLYVLNNYNKSKIDIFSGIRVKYIGCLFIFVKEKWILGCGQINQGIKFVPKVKQYIER